jgi:hypothetical protein
MEFQRQLAATPFGHAQLMPYFEGYCGSPRLRSLSATVPVRRHAARHHYYGKKSMFLFHSIVQNKPLLINNTTRYGL